MREDDGGGTVYALGTGATRFQNVIFKDNTGDYGGAVYARSSGKMTFSSCRFLGNKATYVRSSHIPPPHQSHSALISLDLSRPLHRRLSVRDSDD